MPIRVDKDASSPMNMKPKLLLGLVGIVLMACPALLASQSRGMQKEPMWKEARRPEAKGTQVATPEGVKKLLKARPDECPDIAVQSDRTAFRVYEVSLGSKFGKALAVWGRSWCFCSPTGNCAFWVVRKVKSGFRILLRTDMVNDFGFLESTANGARDLITWSHGSASMAGASLFVFDGKQYVNICGWEEDYQGHALPDGMWKWDPQPKFSHDTCNAGAIPAH
jgi:hypothetical protein